MRYPIAVVSAVLLVAAAARQAPAIEARAAADFRSQVEADWFLQEKLRHSKPKRDAVITTRADAAGAVDGVKDGRWAFHTESEDNPWWHVDLGKVVPVSRVVIWNRCDAADRVSRLAILLSADGADWRKVYAHDGTVFYGATDKKPLVVKLGNGLDSERARFVRIQVPGRSYFHLDEVEVFGPGEGAENIALGRPADQSSVSQWSSNSLGPKVVGGLAGRASEVIERARALAARLRGRGVDCSAEIGELACLETKLGGLASGDDARDVYLSARWVRRRMALRDPLLDFDAILFAKRVPGVYNHMSDQYYGWWSRPGGGLYALRGLKGAAPTVECVSGAFTEPGSFLRPSLSYDAKKVIFAWCRHYPHVAGLGDKLNKANVPEDAFYHVFEMNVDGTGLRQLTRGKYDDFDARYLPDGRIVFLSTRRGQAVRVGPESAALTLGKPDLPDCYVRCGGGPGRPVAVYTLHTMRADGSGIEAISPFEMFEWTPHVAPDGRILYSRWDYVDRSNSPFMSLWSTAPDGTNARLVYGNYTRNPHCTFEPRYVPGSHKIVFTGSGHHAQTMGSLCLLDPTVGTEGAAPITRLSPEVAFPEIEGWPETYYAHPWPLSERLYLVAWGRETNVREGGRRPANGMGLYLFDADGEMELLHRDPEITSAWPLPVKPRPLPHQLPDLVESVDPATDEGRFLLADVYRGLKSVEPGDIKALRIVALPVKTHPTMNRPQIGVTADDPGKCVIGTVPVEPDGSAHFRVPSGVAVFFQALDGRGMAVQTMRSATYVQPGQTLSCIGCHEPRTAAPPVRLARAARRAPSKIIAGPQGSWPLRFDKLVQPVLDRNCVRCHSPGGEMAAARRIDLRPEGAYWSLVKAGKPSLCDHVRTRYDQGYSVEGACAATASPVIAQFDAPKGHNGVKLDADARERLVTWMDTYAQRLGSFSDEQERLLVQLREDCARLLVERPAAPGGASVTCAP